MLAAPTIPRGQLLRPYPQFDGVFLKRPNVSRSRYDALVTSVNRRYDGGWTLHTSYTWSRTRDSQFSESNFFAGGSFLMNNYDVDAEYGLSALDTPHRIIVNGPTRLRGGRTLDTRDLRSGMSLIAAGLAAGIARGHSVPEAVKLGIACGAANALTEMAGHLSLADVQRLLEEFAKGRLTVGEEWNVALAEETARTIDQLSNEAATAVEQVTRADVPVTIGETYFHIPDETWARVIYDMALAHHARRLAVDQLVADGIALPGPVMGPLAEDETIDGCHANEAGMALMGEQLVDFFGAEGTDGVRGEQGEGMRGVGPTPQPDDGTS